MSVLLNIKSISLLISGAIALTASAQLPAEGSSSSLQVAGLSADGKTVTLSGHIDARDLVLTRTPKPGAMTLDLSAASVGEFAGRSEVYMGRSYFAAARIPAYIFFQTPYREILLPSGITCIEEGAFAGADLVEITIPDGVDYIAENAFYGCPNLREVTLPSSLTRIGKGAFANCPALEYINLADTRVKDIAERLFEGCISLNALRMPSGIQSIGSHALSGTAIKHVALTSVSSLAPYALADMPALEEADINPNAKIGEGVLMNSPSLKKVRGVPANIPALFAANCYQLPASETMAGSSSIGSYALANTEAETLVLLPGLSFLDLGSLSGLTSLTHIDATELKADIPALHPDAFPCIPHEEVKLKVTDDAYDLWKADPQWGKFNVYCDRTTDLNKVLPQDNSIRFLFETPGEIRIVSDLPIKDGAIYDANGNCIAMLAAGLTDQTLTLPSEKGVYLVTASDENSTKSLKFMK